MMKSKSEVFAESMNKGSMQATAVILDARHPRVTVPGQYKDNPTLKLNFAWGFAQFSCFWDEDGIAASLTFGGIPFPCYIPWEAVYAIAPVGVDGIIRWEGSQPGDVSLVTPQPEPQPAVRGHKHLRALPPAIEEREGSWGLPEGKKPTTVEEAVKQVTRPGLRLVRPEDLN